MSRQKPQSVKLMLAPVIRNRVAGAFFRLEIAHGNRRRRKSATPEKWNEIAATEIAQRKSPRLKIAGNGNREGKIARKGNHPKWKSPRGNRRKMKIVPSGHTEIENRATGLARKKNRPRRSGGRPEKISRSARGPPCGRSCWWPRAAPPQRRGRTSGRSRRARAS